MSKQTVKVIKKVATKQALTYLYGCFRVMGIHFTKSHTHLYLIYVIVIHSLTTVFTPISFTTSYFRKTDENFNMGVFLTSVQAVINVYGCIVKIFFLVYYKKKLEAAEKLMDQMDQHCQADDEIQEIYNIRNLGRRIIIGYGIAYWIYTTMTYISALASGVPSYSLNLFLIDWRRSKSEFYVASFIEYFLTSWTCFQQVANDSYGTIYVCILRGHVRILLLRIRKMGRKVNRTADQNLEELKTCIKDHKELIE